MHYIGTVEWEKFTFFFLSEIGPFLFLVPHTTDLNSRLVHVDGRIKRENAAIFETDVVD